MFQVSDLWKATYPTAHAGVLVMREVINPPHHAELEKRKAALEEELRARFAGQDRTALLSHPILASLRCVLSSVQKNISRPASTRVDPLQGQIHSQRGGIGRGHVHGGSGYSASHGGTRSGCASSAPDAGRGARNRILYFAARRTTNTQSRRHDNS